MTPCACQKESAPCDPDTFPISVKISYFLVSLLGEQFLGQPEGVARVLREQLSIPPARNGSLEVRVCETLKLM